VGQVRRRLSPFSRLLLCQRVQAGRPVAHVAAELGVSRQTAYRWWRRYRVEGPAGMVDRPCRPRTSPSRLAGHVEVQVLALRLAERRGPVWIAARLGLHASTVGRVLRRAQVLPLRDLDPLTGAVLRPSRPASDRRYEYDQPGGLIHLDVKKLGRIPDGGGWRVHGRREDVRGRTVHGQPIGYDYVHVAVDDHSRAAYAEVLPDERGATCAGFLRRAAAHFADLGIARIERVMTDNALNYRRSAEFAAALADLGARHKLIRPHCPWTNGKAERFNRTLQTEWAYRQPFTSNTARTSALPGWLQHYNTDRHHTALAGPPTSRLSPS
jgi:transposase InsO family protein